MARKPHSTFELRKRAVDQVLKENKPVRVVAEEIGYNPDSIYNWLHRYKKRGEDGLKDSSKTMRSKVEDQGSLADAKRIKELEKKLKEKELENEILKKFQAFLK
ncbi:helix-turn-helix domain-containing protein, partial [Bacillus sp. NTK071]|uniref:helix-turn-helix domain-containing protein n=1 Tax=Bacillus sp. NTK071 TaxID=2802175 RepID=UPI001A8D3844